MDTYCSTSARALPSPPSELRSRREAGRAEVQGLAEGVGGEGADRRMAPVFEALLRHSGDHVLLLDGSHRIVEAGDAFVATFMPGADLRGEDFFRLLDRGSREKARMFLDAATAGSCTTELSLRAGATGTRLANFTFCPIPVPGDPGMIAAIGRDQEEPLAMVERLVGLNQKLEEARREIEQQAMTDVLTGLGNRRWMFDRLDALWATAGRQGHLAWVMMADLDHFKRINDTYGHRTGDEALAAVGHTLRRSVRAGDMVARYGGEEFVVAGTCRDRSEVGEVAQRLLVEIRAVRFGSPEPTLRLTISLGAALADPGNTTPPWVGLQAADRAVYRAKAAGRDRCEVEPGVLGRPTGAGGTTCALMGRSARLS